MKLISKLPIRYQVFVFSFCAVFLMVGLPHLGLTFPRTSFEGIVSPLPEGGEDSLKNLYPKLEQKESEYKLVKGNSLIPRAQATEDFTDLNAYAVVDFDSGKVITEKNLDQKVSIASVTKIMTAVVALDLASDDELFTVSEHAASIIPTKIGVVPGQKMTLSELLHALILTSANDSAEVIMEGINTKYGNQVFLKAMNAKAKFLGLKNSHFENPQGFDGADHYSSAGDLAILTHYALTQYPLVTEIAKKQYQFLPEDQNHKQFDLYNWNGLLGVYPGATGLKIGNTGRAGKTTIVTAEREGKRVMVIVLGAPGVLERDLWAAQLLDIGFEREFALPPVEITEAQLKEKYGTWKYFN